ncbi:MAG: nucleotidyltransferase family protein [Desulfomonile tiedjei]|nr:nucleotidyltransferase family protein [Desulfomonile tiedjei]
MPGSSGTSPKPCWGRSSNGRPPLVFLRWLASRHLDPSQTPPVPPPATEEEWRDLAAQAGQHSVAGLAYWNLSPFPRDGDGACPASVRETLRESYHRNIARNLLWREELARLAPAFLNRGLQPIVLRGLTFLGTLYPDDGMRSSDDCDLCVRPAEQAQAHALLLELGYERRLSGVNLYSHGAAHLDLHTGFGDEDRIRSRARLHRIDVEQVWAEATPFPTGGGDLLQLSLRDSLLINALHLLKHDYESLIWKLDLAALMLQLTRRSQWRDVLERAEALGLTIPLACAAAYGEGLLPDLLQGIRDSVKHALPAGAARRLFRFLRQDRALDGLSGLVMVWMIPRIPDRVRFLAETMLPVPGIRAGMREEWKERGTPRSFPADRMAKLLRALRCLIALIRAR